VETVEEVAGKQNKRHQRVRLRLVPFYHHQMPSEITQWAVHVICIEFTWPFVAGESQGGAARELEYESS
jgi:hypothetical protein